MKKVCPVCGVEFEGKHKDKKYCSKKCGKKEYYENNKEKVREWNTKYQENNKERRNEKST